MKKIFLLFIVISLFTFSNCAASKSGQYHGGMTRKNPCAQGCD